MPKVYIRTKMLLFESIQSLVLKIHSIPILRLFSFELNSMQIHCPFVKIPKNFSQINLIGIDTTL